MGLEAPRPHFRVPPKSLARKIRGFYSRVSKRVKWVSLHGLSPGSPRRALLKRLESRYQSKIWWASVTAASEGFVLGLPVSAKRSLSTALGWAFAHPNHGSTSALQK